MNIQYSSTNIECTGLYSTKWWKAQWYCVKLFINGFLYTRYTFDATLEIQDNPITIRTKWHVATDISNRVFFSVYIQLSCDKLHWNIDVTCQRELSFSKMMSKLVFILVISSYGSFVSSARKLSESWWMC